MSVPPNADSVLVPPLDWVDNPDPEYDQPCPVCSALVEVRAVHRAWHLAMVERLDRISEKAGRYVPPPTYFGHTLDELAEVLTQIDGSGATA